MTSNTTSLVYSGGVPASTAPPRVVRMAVSGGRNSCADTAARSWAEPSAALVRPCSVQIPSSRPLGASPISTGSVARRRRCKVSPRRSPGLVRQAPERKHCERGQHPARRSGGGDAERADDQDPAEPGIGIGVGGAHR